MILPLLFLAIVLHFIAGIAKRHGLATYPRHCQAEGVIVRFFQERAPNMGNLQVIKEHINVSGYIAGINIQITALLYVDTVTHQRTVHFTALHLFKTTAAGHIIKLIIQQHPV